MPIRSFNYTSFLNLWGGGRSIERFLQNLALCILK